jgi:hypothetical protein
MEERLFRRSNQNLGTFSSVRAPAQAGIEDELVIHTNPESRSSTSGSRDHLTGSLKLVARGPQGGRERARCNKSLYGTWTPSFGRRIACHIDPDQAPWKRYQQAEGPQPPAPQSFEKPVGYPSAASSLALKGWLARETYRNVVVIGACPMIACRRGAETFADRPTSDPNVCRPTSYIFPGLILVALKAAVSAGPIVFFPRNFPVSPTRLGGGQTRSVSALRGADAAFHLANSAPSLGAIGTLRALPDWADLPCPTGRSTAP